MKNMLTKDFEICTGSLSKSFEWRDQQCFTLKINERIEIIQNEFSDFNHERVTRTLYTQYFAQQRYFEKHFFSPEKSIKSVVFAMELNFEFCSGKHVCEFNKSNISPCVEIFM